MTRDQTGSNQPPATTDDERLAGLVRAVATDWTLPPQRLDQATWRDRVAPAAPRRWRSRRPRLAAPALGAVVITVAVAFAAVWLDGPRPAAISGASPSPTGSSSPSDRPTAAPPKVIVNGPLPDPASVLVRAGNDYRVVDLTHGTLGPRVVTANGASHLYARPDGGWLCVCPDWEGSVPGRLPVAIALVDASGMLESTSTIRDIVGRADPALSGTDPSQLVDAHASVSADGRFAFLGWAAREGAAGWRLGIDIIDVAAGRMVGSSELPQLASATKDGKPVTRVAPEVSLAPSGRTVLVSDFWFAPGDQESPPSGFDHWSAKFAGTSVTAFAPTRSTDAGSCDELAEGSVDVSTWWVVCSTNGAMRFDRVGSDGNLLGSTPLPPSDGMTAPLVDPSGKALYMWGPVGKTLTRIDIASGTFSSVTARIAATTADPVADLAHAIGRWMAPPVAAKIFVDPGLVLSPDGTRIFALAADPGNGETVSSQGVFVFDAVTLEQIAHWPPTADLTSIAISPDGAWLYAAGQPGFDAAGKATGDPSSITVYATSDGGVDLTAGRLGYEALSFTAPVLP